MEEYKGRGKPYIYKDYIQIHQEIARLGAGNV